MSISGYTRTLACCAALFWPESAHPQVVAQLNEQAAGATFEEISTGSAGQFIGDRFVAFAGAEKTGPYDGLWLRDLHAPRGVIEKLGLRFVVDAWQISPDRRYVAFTSTEPLVRDKTNVCFRSDDSRQVACTDLFLSDLSTGLVTRILGPEKREIAAHSSGAIFSADGRWVVFQRRLAAAPGTQPAEVLLHDRERGDTTLVSGSLFAHTVSISRDATRVTFAAIVDTSRPSIMVYDRQTNATERVDVDLPAGLDAAGFPSFVSGNGRFVAFEGRCSTCPAISTPRILIRDLLWKRTFQAVRAFDGSEPGSGIDVKGISAEGRFLLLESSSRDLVENDPSFGDVFVLDRITNTMVRVSQNLNGAQPNGVSFNPAMDSRARHVSFASQATNLLPHAVSPSVNLFLASLDLDNDGIHDSWERFFDGSPLLTGPELDDDGDGVSNLQEFERGTHPRGRFGVRIPILQEPPGWGLKLHNQTSRPATAVIRFVDQAGHGAARAFRIPALSGLPIRSPDIPDRPPVPYTIEIESDEPLFGLTRR